VPHGLGRSISVKKQLYYLGHWVNGKYHGIGQLTRQGYSEYNGEFRDGNKCGYGKLSFINQDVISMDGFWNDNILTCTCGLIKYKDGSYYKGAIENFERSGYGEYYFSNGNTYLGHWLNNMQHGSGRFVVKDTMEFITFWKDGVPDPPYKIKYPDGSAYYGMCNDFFMPHGYGIKKYADGSVYKGFWTNNMRNGYGMHLYPNKFNDMELRYVTILENNTKLKHKCSDYYCGEWINDKKNGVGRQYYSLGSFVLEYLWNDDVPLFVTRRYYY